MVVCFIIIYFFELMVVESAKVKGDCVIIVGNKGNYLGTRDCEGIGIVSLHVHAHLFCTA